MSAINIRVLYFGIVRERLGLHDEQLQLAADSTVADLTGLAVQDLKIAGAVYEALA